jgi:hypothetical protein
LSLTALPAASTIEAPLVCSGNAIPASGAEAAEEAPGAGDADDGDIWTVDPTTATAGVSACSAGAGDGDMVGWDTDARITVPGPGQASAVVTAATVSRVAAAATG